VSTADGAIGGLVEVSRSGGFAGMTLHGRVDLGRLEPAEQARWHAALTDGLAGLAEGTSGHPGPDRFVYRVRHQATGLDVTVGDHQIPADLRALLDSAVRPPP
jgi:hypothetical protein